MPSDRTEEVYNFVVESARAAGYLRLSSTGIALAVSLGAGYNLQLNRASQTYPDRLFFMGGVDTLMSDRQKAFVPEMLKAKRDAAKEWLQANQARLS